MASSIIGADGVHAARHKAGGADPIAPGDIGAVASSTVGAAGGVASLDTGGHVPVGQVPDLSGTYVSKPSVREFAIVDHGAHSDGVQLADVSTTAGGATVVSASYQFAQKDVGKQIAVLGAGPQVAGSNDGVWLGTIVSVDGGVATVDSPATSTTNAATCVFGTNDDAAVLAAHNAASAAGGGTVFFPPGITIVSAQLTIADYVSFAGVSRAVSHVWILKNAASGNLRWLTVGAVSLTNPRRGVNVQNFAIHCSAYISSVGYSSSLKPLDCLCMSLSSVANMAVYDSPATAVPWDQGRDQNTIAFNYIYNPGRLAPSGVGPGGSGIGMGTTNWGDVNPTLVVGNVIIGTQTADVAAPGVNGIFVEAEGENTGITTGYRIVGNIVIGMPIGIASDGAQGTVIQGNTLIGCGIGIGLNQGTVDAGFPGIDTLVSGNCIANGTGPASNDGSGIVIAYSSGSTHPGMTGTLRALLVANKIIDCKANGISISLAAQDVDGLAIESNEIVGNGTNGIFVYNAGSNVLSHLRITGNRVTGNGATNYGNGIYLEGPIKYGLIQGNDLTGNHLQALDLGSPLDSTSLVADNIGLAAPGPAAVAVGASPWTYTAHAYRTSLYISGGAVTSIQKSGVSLPTSGTVALMPGESVSIAYTAAPTVIADEH